jgi:hypothetical protein
MLLLRYSQITGLFACHSRDFEVCKRFFTNGIDRSRISFPVKSEKRASRYEVDLSYEQPHNSGGISWLYRVIIRCLETDITREILVPGVMSFNPGGSDS